MCIIICISCVSSYHMYHHMTCYHLIMCITCIILSYVSCFFHAVMKSSWCYRVVIMCIIRIIRIIIYIYIYIIIYVSYVSHVSHVSCGNAHTKTAVRCIYTPPNTHAIHPSTQKKKSRSLRHEVTNPHGTRNDYFRLYIIEPKYSGMRIHTCTYALYVSNSWLSRRIGTRNETIYKSRIYDK